MRKILFLLGILLSLCSCEYKLTDDKGVVQSVKYNFEGDSDKYYYHVYVKGSAKLDVGYHLYTNTLYTVGDTIVIK